MEMKNTVLQRLYEALGQFYIVGAELRSQILSD